MTAWSMYTPTFNGKLLYNNTCHLKCLVECLYSLFVSLRLFPLQEPGMNYEASPLTREEIEVKLLKATKLKPQKKVLHIF